MWYTLPNYGTAGAQIVRHRAGVGSRVHTEKPFSGRVMKAVIDYLETLTLKGGDHDDEPFAVLPWERRFIRGAFAAAHDSALSVARGDGKSCLVAGLACAVVDPEGPLHANRRHVDCFASSFDQGRTIFEDVLAFLGERHDLEDRKRWRKQDTANRATLEYKPTGARVRCLGSDPKRAHGLRSWLALCVGYAAANRCISTRRTS